MQASKTKQKFWTMLHCITQSPRVFVKSINLLMVWKPLVFWIYWGAIQLRPEHFLQVSHTTLTAEVVDGLFKFEMSDEGSKRNQNEQAILFNWNQFLEDVEHSLATSRVFDPCTNSQVHVQLSLKSVVAFVTGSTGIPPLGFSPQPKIVFDHQGTDRKLHVSTCSNTLYFTVNEVILKYETFKEEFVFCMLNSPGFGSV